MIKKSNKSQMGIFVIISVIVVVIGFMIFTIDIDNIRIFKDQTSSYRIETFVESCMEFETKQGIDLIGAHSGWLYHPQMTFTNRSKPQEYNKRALGLDFLEKVKMPYWYYYDDSKEDFVINIPEYDTENPYSLKNQLKKHISDNIEKNCINKFSNFDDIYKIKYDSNLIKDGLTVEFIEDKLSVSLKLPVTITEKNTNNSEYIDKFEIKYENKLWIPYHIAKDITYSQANSSFIEKRILQFIRPYQSSKDRNLLPPFYKYDMVYDFRPWYINSVKTLFTQIVSSNIVNIQFLNTDYEEYSLKDELKSSEFAKGFSEIYTKDYLSEYSVTKDANRKLFRKYADYKVTPVYQSSFYPTYFSISPSMGNVILLPRPSAVINLIPIFFTEYVAVYQATLPITFEIKSNKGNDNFVFNLAIEANIDHNSPLKENRDTKYDINEISSQAKSLICNPSQFISEEILLNITDPIDYGNADFNDRNKTGIESAIITFDCKGISKCFIGETSKNSATIQNNITQLSLRLPINCYPGTLEIYKYGHKLVKIENINPTIDKKIVLGEFNMSSKKEIGLKIKILGKESETRYSVGRDINRNEIGFLIFSNLDDSSIVDVAEINYDNQYDLKINLTDGNYKVEGFIMHNKSFTVPAKRICYKSNLFSEDCVDMPEMEMDSWVSAGIDKEFEVKAKHLLTREEIIVPFTEYGIPLTYDELEEISKRMGEIKNLSQLPYME